MPNHATQTADVLPQTGLPTYRSGTAARLSGVPVATLRVWERRYQVIGPQTSASGHRHYSGEEIGRLVLIKALVDVGHPIGAIAHLATATLQAQLDAHAPDLRPLRPVPHGGASGAIQAGPIRAALVGASLVAQTSNQLPAGLAVVATCADPQLAADVLHGKTADLLAMELVALRDDAVPLVMALAAQLGATQLVVAYRYGTQAAVRSLRAQGAVVLRLPVDWAEVVLAGAATSTPLLHDAIAVAARTPTPPRFNDISLAALAHATPSMYCECPRHVVELLSALGTFERYSAECQNRGLQDAQLHRYLHNVAGTARVLFEEALVKVALAEGLALPQDSVVATAATAGAPG